MSLYRCTKCGCVENTALGDYHGARMEKRPPQCSECATGTWHGRFPKRSAVGMLVDDGGGLWTRAQINGGALPKAYKIVGQVKSGCVERESLLYRIRKQRAEIAQFFDDIAQWNSTNPYRPIDPDPDGQLRRIAEALDKTLSKEGANDSTATATVQPIVAEGEQR